MTTRQVLLPASLLPSQLRTPTSACHETRPAERFALGDPGWPTAEPTLLIADFDNSGSVTSPVGTDPLSNRFAEVAYAFAVVAKRGSRHELGAVLHFDTTSSGDVGPVPITRRGLRKLRSGLRTPRGGRGSSELSPSLRRAVALATAHPDHQATLVVLSDFLLLDPQPPSQVLADLAAFPGVVHAVVLGATMPRSVFDERIVVTPIHSNDPPGAVARALFASLTTYRRRSRLTGRGVPHRRLSWIPQRTDRRNRFRPGRIR